MLRPAEAPPTNEGAAFETMESLARTHGVAVNTANKIMDITIDAGNAFIRSAVIK